MNFWKRFSIPTPFNVGRVNCFLFPDQSLTLLDPGPASEEAYEELLGNLTNNGCNLKDIDRILITHPHIDHFGNAERISELANASVLAHEHATRHLADPIKHFKREREFFRPFLLSMGMPRETVNTVLELPEAYSDFQHAVTVDRELTDGEHVDVGIELECIATPGHAPGSICFGAPTADVVFTGDHLLPHITPNPLLTLVPGTDDERTRSLPTYLDSLRKLLSYEATAGYGGHGNKIMDLHGRVRETIAHHERRKETIADLVAESEPVTAYRIMQDMFPDIPVTEMFPGMSEVIGHLDLLDDENRIKTTSSDGLVMYELEEI